MAETENRFWDASPHNGRTPHYDDPDKMRADALEYLQWVDDNPLYEVKAFGTGYTAKVPKMRAATQSGLQIFLGMSRQSWQDYRKKDLFSAVVEEIEQMISEQKFVGAAAGFLNANIIARDLGLVDKQEADVRNTILVQDNFKEDEE